MGSRSEHNYLYFSALATCPRVPLILCLQPLKSKTAISFLLALSPFYPVSCRFPSICLRAIPRQKCPKIQHPRSDTTSVNAQSFPQTFHTLFRLFVHSNLVRPRPGEPFRRPF